MILRTYPSCTITSDDNERQRTTSNDNERFQVMSNDIHTYTDTYTDTYKDTYTDTNKDTDTYTYKDTDTYTKEIGSAEGKNQRTSDSELVSKDEINRIINLISSTTQVKPRKQKIEDVISSWTLDGETGEYIAPSDWVNQLQRTFNGMA